MIKADLHMHTQYSLDSRTTLAEITERCLALGIGAIAISDHGTTEGALLLQKTAPFQVIVAEEVLTTCGEIMGMFLRETIRGGLSPDETVARIKDQGGLVCIPHPYDTFRGSALESSELERLAEAGQIDIIEVLNARTMMRRSLLQAERLAARCRIARSAGSDAHAAIEIGTAYVTMPPFEGRDDFLAALSLAEICGHRNPMVRFRGLAGKLARITGGK